MREISVEMMMPWFVAAAMLLLGWVVIKVLNKIVKKALKKSSLDPVLYKFISSALMAVCWIVLIGTVLSYVGVPLSTFITVLGVGGAAIALSLKDSLGNIAGGVIIIISKPFKKGDFIEIDKVVGKVDQIDLLFTKLLTIDNKVIHIPNGTLGTSMIMNYSSEQKRRVDCKFGISGTSDILKAKDILSVIAEQSDMILREPVPLIGVVEQSNGIVFFDMKVWCATDDFWTVKYFLEENVKLAFDEAGIEMPVPHINVHAKK
jgi:small conductance mechanosensitive channel